MLYKTQYQKSPSCSPPPSFYLPFSCLPGSFHCRHRPTCYSLEHSIYNLFIISLPQLFFLYKIGWLNYVTFLRASLVSLPMEPALIILLKSSNAPITLLQYFFIALTTLWHKITFYIFYAYCLLSLPFSAWDPPFPMWSLWTGIFVSFVYCCTPTAKNCLYIVST